MGSKGEGVTVTVQIGWRDTIIDSSLGSVGFVELRGWLDSPDIRQNDADRSGRHGQIPGQLLAGSRIFEIDWLILDGLASTLYAMQTATALDEDPVEEPFMLSGIAPWPAQQVACRPTHWAVPTAAQFFRSNLRQGTWQFKATDPRVYSADQNQLVTGLAISGGSGVPWPAGYPLNFGPLPSGGSINVPNAGSAATWPVFILDGPLTGPSITNLDTGRTIAFNPGFVLPAGQRVIIDTDAKSITQNGVSRRDSVLTAQWFPIPGSRPATPSVVRLGFSAVAAEAGLLTVQWRDAWL